MDVRKRYLAVELFRSEAKSCQAHSWLVMVRELAKANPHMGLGPDIWSLPGGSSLDVE